MLKPAKRIGEILVARGFITEGQLADGLLEQKINNVFLGEILIKRGWLTERRLLEALSEQFGIPLVNIKDQRVDGELAHAFASSLVVDKKCFPLSKGDSSITIAIVNPLNAQAMSEAEEAARPLEVNFVLVSEEDFQGLLNKYRMQISRNILKMLKKDKQ